MQQPENLTEDPVFFQWSQQPIQDHGAVHCVQNFQRRTEMQTLLLHSQTLASEFLIGAITSFITCLHIQLANLYTQSSFLW